MIITFPDIIFTGRFLSDVLDEGLIFICLFAYIIWFVGDYGECRLKLAVSYLLGRSTTPLSFIDVSVSDTILPVFLWLLDSESSFEAELF